MYQTCRANVRQIIFAARYGPHLGNYMMHCHNVVHEDHDMLRAFLVRRYSAPSASDCRAKALRQSANLD
jgi:Multicopper oxidase